MVMGFLIIPVIIILLLALFFTFVPVGLWISSLASWKHITWPAAMWTASWMP